MIALLAAKSLKFLHS